MNDVAVNGAPVTTKTHAAEGSSGAPWVNSDDI